MTNIDPLYVFDAEQKENKMLREQKDNAYSERNKCVVGLMLLARDLGYKVGLARHPEDDLDWENDWRNIGVIELPTGQLTWHFHDSEMHMLYSFCRLEGYEWDGHSTDEKYRRLLNYSPKLDILLKEFNTTIDECETYRKENARLQADNDSLKAAALDSFMTDQVPYHKLQAQLDSANKQLQAESEIDAEFKHTFVLREDYDKLQTELDAVKKQNELLCENKGVVFVEAYRAVLSDFSKAKQKWLDTQQQLDAANCNLENTVSERDYMELAFSQLYTTITDKPMEWSSGFGTTEAIWECEQFIVNIQADLEAQLDAANLQLLVAMKHNYVGAPKVFLLEMACREINKAFDGFGCYQVGSSLERPDYRDVDIRYIMEDEKFKQLFPSADINHFQHDMRWLLVTTSIAERMARITGLPIDFQIQPQSHANERHQGKRHAVGLIVARKDEQAQEQGESS